MRGCYNGDWVSEWAAQWRRKYGLILFFFFPDFLPFYVFVSSSQTPTRTIKTNKTKQTNILKLPFVEAKRASNHTLLFPSPQSKQFFKIHTSFHTFFDFIVLDWIEFKFNSYDHNTTTITTTTTHNTKRKKKETKDKTTLRKTKNKHTWLMLFNLFCSPFLYRV